MEGIEKKRGFPFYPRHIKTSDGYSVVVKDHIEHGKRIGRKVLPDATVLEPPTLETVIKAGYPGHVAEKMVADEREKFEKGYKPYGDIEPPAPVDPSLVAPQESQVEENPILESVEEVPVVESNLESEPAKEDAPQDKPKHGRPAKAATADPQGDW